MWCADASLIHFSITYIDHHIQHLSNIIVQTMLLSGYALFYSSLIASVGAFSFVPVQERSKKIGTWGRGCAHFSMAAQQETVTEASILARNQGHLTMATQEEIDDAKAKHGKDVDDKKLDESESVHSGYSVKHDSYGFGSILMENGVARIDNVLSENTAKTMKKYTNGLLLGATAAVESGAFSRDHLFGNVANPNNRWDLLLPIEASEEVMDSLCEVLYEGSPLSTAIESILGRDAELYELSTLISDPGSQAQPLHPDIVYQDTIHPILTCFIALQDITEDMGPTVFMPKSATEEHHNDLKNRHLDPEAKGLVATAYNELGTLNIGDCSMYSAMTLHCGSANQSDTRRSLFYFSFRNNSLLDSDGGRNYVSLRPELKDRELTLESIYEIIQKRREHMMN